jgi:hypothetical protein
MPAVCRSAIFQAASFAESITLDVTNMHNPIATLLCTQFLAVAASACLPSKPEPWEPFLARYSNSQQFALDRTRFPLPVLVREYGVDDKDRPATEYRTMIVSKTEYSKGAALAPYATANGLQLRIRSLSSATAIVELFKPNSDNLILYRFRLIRGCWHLRQIENQSL